MYEVRKAGKKYRVYDRINKKYIANTKDEEKARTLVVNLLCCGFEGDMPNFLINEKYCLDLDKGVTYDEL